MVLTQLLEARPPVTARELIISAQQFFRAGIGEIVPGLRMIQALKIGPVRLRRPKPVSNRALGNIDLDGDRLCNGVVWLINNH